MNIIIRKSIDNLSKRSNSILNIFTKTVNKLEKVNSDINDEIDKDTEELREISENIDSLKLLKESNHKIISKIKSFIDN